LDLVDFLCVYIAEAHASDTWPLGCAVSVAKKAKVEEERAQTAVRVLKRERGLQMPLAMDGMGDLFMQRYACWPERFFVLYQGRVAYIAHYKFRPSEIEAWIQMYQHVTGLRTTQSGGAAGVAGATGPMVAEPVPPSECQQDAGTTSSLAQVCETDVDLYQRLAAVISGSRNG
jgi:hypothetical protein